MPNPIKFYYTNESVGGYKMWGTTGGVVIDYLYGVNTISLRVGGEYIPLIPIEIPAMRGRKVLAQLSKKDYGQVEIPAEKRKEYPPVFGRQEFDWLSYAHFQVPAASTYIEFCMPISAIIANYEGAAGARILSLSVPDLEVTFHIYIRAFLSELKRAVSNRVFTIVPSFNETKYELLKDTDKLGYNLYPAGEDTNEKEGGIWGEILFAYFPILIDEIEPNKPAWGYLFLFWNTKRDLANNPVTTFILMPKSQKEATPAFIQGVTNISLKKGAWRVWKCLYPTGNYTFNPYPNIPTWRRSLGSGSWIFLASVGNQLFSSPTPTIYVNNNRFPLVVYQTLWFRPVFLGTPTNPFYYEIQNVFEATVGMTGGELKAIIPREVNLGVRAGHSILIEDTNYSPTLTYKAVITNVRFKHAGETIGVSRGNTAGRAKIVEIEFQNPYTVDFHTNPVRLRSLLGLKVRELLNILRAASPIQWNIRFALQLYANGEKQPAVDITDNMLDLRLPDLFPEGIILNSLEDYLLILGHFAHLALLDLEQLYGELYARWEYDFSTNTIYIVVTNYSHGVTEEGGKTKVVAPSEVWDFRNTVGFITRWESETSLDVGSGTTLPPQNPDELRLKLLEHTVDVTLKETSKLRVEFKGIIPPVPPEQVKKEQEVRIYFRDDYFVDGRVSDYTIILEQDGEVTYSLELSEVRGNIGGTWLLGELPLP